MWGSEWTGIHQTLLWFTWIPDSSDKGKCKSTQFCCNWVLPAQILSCYLGISSQGAALYLSLLGAQRMSPASALGPGVARSCSQPRGGVHRMLVLLKVHEHSNSDQKKKKMTELKSPVKPQIFTSGSAQPLAPLCVFYQRCATIFLFFWYNCLS